MLNSSSNKIIDSLRDKYPDYDSLLSYAAIATKICAHHSRPALETGNYFISGDYCHMDDLGMPKFIRVVPSIGADIAMIYEYKFTDRIR